MESVRIFFLVIFTFMIALIVADFIGEEKNKKLETTE